MHAQPEALLRQERSNEALALFLQQCAAMSAKDVEEGLRQLLPCFIGSGQFDAAATFVKHVMQQVAPGAAGASDALREIADGVANMAAGIDIGEATFADGRRFRVRARPLRHTRPGVAFRNQCHAKYCQQTTRSVIGVTRRISLTQGSHQRWIDIHLAQGEVLRTVLQLTNNEFVFFSTRQDEQGHQRAHGIYIFDSKWNLLYRSRREGFPPYGIQSIDQSWTGTICYGEYASQSETIRIWRSTDFGRSWTCVLELPGKQQQGNPEHIRHFHICQADPYIAGRWYALSGDRNDENRLFISEDDGQTWRQVTPELHILSALAEERQAEIRRHFLRTTAVIFHEDAIYFASDDTLGGLGPCLSRMEKHAPYRTTTCLLAADASLPPEARQEIRSLVDIGNGLFCAVSQQNPGMTGAGVFICDTEGHTAFAGILPLTVSDSPQSTTSGYHSLQATPDGRFHTLMLGACPQFYQSPRTLEWEVIEETPKELLSRCPCCDPQMEGVPLRLRKSLAARRNGWEYRCPHCGSQTRIRTMYTLLRGLAHEGKGRTLAFAASKLELDGLAATIADDITNVAAHDRGANITAGWDMRHLPDVPSETYHYVFACCVVDYIPELMLAAREMHRLLVPGGHFIFNIKPYRLRFAKDEQARIEVTSFNALSHENYNYHRQEHEGGATYIPDCTFSFAWVQRCLLDACFVVTPHMIWDEWSQRHEFWIDAKK